MLEKGQGQEINLQIRAGNLVLSLLDVGITRTGEFIEHCKQQGYSQPTIARALANLRDFVKRERIQKGAYRKKLENLQPNNYSGGWVKDDEEAKFLMTIPGIDYYSAPLITSEIGDIHRFPSAKQLCSYAGVVPSTYSSGSSTFHGHITKQGSRWLRWIVAEAVVHCINKPGHVQEFYQRVQKRKGVKIAKVATRRKILE